MRKVKHWLHLLLVVLTFGVWLFPYVIIIATTEMYNRGYAVGKQAGRVEKANEGLTIAPLEISTASLQVHSDGLAEFINSGRAAKSLRNVRFDQLGHIRNEQGYLLPEQHDEYQALHREFGNHAK